MRERESDKNIFPGFTAISSIYNTEATYSIAKDRLNATALIIPTLSCCNECCKTLHDCYEQGWYDPLSLCYKYFGRNCQMCLAHCMPCRINDS